MTAGVIAAVSCAKESVNDAPSKDSQTVLCANIEQTKTALDGLSIVWSENDALTVLDNKGAKATFTLQSGAGQQSGQFVGTLPQSEGATCFYAVYPQNDNVALSGAAISVNVPTTQTYVENNVGIGANMSIAQFTLDSKDNLSFMNTGGLLKLQLYASDVTVKQIVVIDNEGKALSGKATATLNVDGIPSLSFTSGAGQVNLDCGEGVHLATTSAEATKFFISVPAGVFAKGFTVKVLDSSDKVYTLKTTKDNTIQRSTILVMGAVELKDPATVVDLNANGETSNCYLISAAGEYKMKANVMGNGKPFGSNPTALAPSSASFLWATKGTGTAPAAGEIIGGVFYLNDCIYFTATGAKGNAVVAANDADGNIIWSWHIWYDSDLKIYGESPANVKAFPMGTDQTVYCIDRELGALSNAKDDLLCAGLRYQWGRKDPFPGPKNYKSSGNAQSDEQQCQGVQRDWLSDKVSVATAVANPTTMYGIKSGSDGWQSGMADNTLWGGTWNSGAHTGTTTKTIYDPCPKGYCVVPKGTFSKCKKSGSWSNGYDLVTTDASATNMGWFPASGYRYEIDGLLRSVGICIISWSSYSASGAVSHFYASSIDFYPDGSAAGNQGLVCPVRCCQVSE